MALSIDERLLDLLRRNRQGLTLQQIFKDMAIARKERAKLEARLIDLENIKLVRRVRNRYSLPLESDLLRGRFETTGRGFGFVIPEVEGRKDVFVPARFAQGALRGDLVEILYKEHGRGGRPEGRVVRILKKEKKNLIGLYLERFGSPFLVPFEAPVLEEIPLVSRGSFFPSAGMIVAVDRSRLVITEVFGMPDEPGVDLEVVIRKYGLASSFSKEALEEGRVAAARPTETANRVDHRDWPTVTIDGETAQDFDDAVSIRKMGDGHFRLGVHIADVADYVEEGSALDREAYARGTSVYFPARTLPMLPEELSNDACSLRPREDRRAVSVVMDIDASGHVLGADFHPSLIRTADRLTYTSVFKVFEGDDAERRRLGSLVPDLLLMRELARSLREKRVAEGSLDFDLVEPELVFKEGRLHSVVAFIPNEAHKLIEEFMVAANVAVAQFLSRKGIPAIYRIHPRPAFSDLEKLRETLFHFGISLPKPENIRSADLSAAIQAASGKPAEKFVNVQVLRALKLAVYAEENIGHYGLAKKDYLHFTSPIRRYPDLMVHRILKRVLRGRSGETLSLAAVARHSSEQERKADEAERDLMEWRIYRHLKEKLGEEFDGMIVDITRSGLVVELEDYFVSGLVAIDDLGAEDFWRKSPAVLSGRRTGKRYELGQMVRVTLAAVDPILRRMSLVFAR